MHYLYYVAIKKEKEQKKFRNLSLELRKQAQNILEQNNFASDNGGYWSSNKADWFVIGGRWSGELSQLKYKKELENLFIKYPKAKEMTNRFFSDTELQKELKDKKSEVYKAEQEWKKLTGATLYRDSYNNLGYEDDATLLDKKLIEVLKKEKYDSTEVAVYGDYGYVENEMLLKDFLKDKKVVNNYYLVVVDYHN